MTTLEQIQDFARQIAERFNPQKIILFGSYAYGTPTPDSDVDLLIVMDHDGRNVKKAAEISSSFRHLFSIDLFVRKPKELDARVKDEDVVTIDILKRGIVLYEA